MPDTILVTGAGRGLGLELATQAQARGHTVIATVRDPGHATAMPPGITVLPLEVTKEEANAAMAAQIAGKPVNTLICNAGVFPARGGIREARYTELDWFSGMMTNVAGPFFAVRALLPNLRLAQSPKVAIIASAMGSSTHAGGGSYIYRASKAAAINLARNLSVELSRQGIAVGVFHPGWVRTDMGTGAAPVHVSNSAAGILERIDSLSIETTGVFEDYLGQPVDF